jgi:hypothetical protein
MRGNRIVDKNSGEPYFRVRDDGRVVDANVGRGLRTDTVSVPCTTFR